jgi:hypothetical protein
VFLDLEGISKVFPENELQLYVPFDASLDALCRIGVNAYPESPYRLYAHQIGGDGLIIVSEFCEGKPEVPISIAVLLMQTLLKMGAVAKGGISEGTYGDYQGCFPSLEKYEKISNCTFGIGRGGKLTIFSTMGTALINSHNYASRQPRGCRLAIDTALIESIPNGVVTYEYAADIIIIDWIHTQTKTMEKIKDLAGLCLPTAEQMEGMLISYIERTDELKNTEWGINSLHFNGCCAAQRKPEVSAIR